MISEARVSKAYTEGSVSWKATKGVPSLTMNRFTRNTSEWREFNKGWNDTRKKHNEVNQKGEINMFDNNGESK